MTQPATSISIFGSCVSRDAFVVADAADFAVRTYVGRQSFVGLADPPLEAQESWYEENSAWLQRVFSQDLDKSGLDRLIEDQSDWLIVDFVDERFNLLDVDGTRVSDIWGPKSPIFRERYGSRGVQQPRISPATDADWAKGLDHFAARIRAHYRPDRVVLHKARWAQQLRAPDGSTSEFPDNAKWHIARCNPLMERYYDLFAKALPEARVIEVDADRIFADPDHRWAIEPFHYTRDYYVEVIRQLRALDRDAS